MKTNGDFTEKLNQARQLAPLKSLMEKWGRGPTNGNWKSFPQCPYCDGKQTAGVFAGPHGDMFKCHHPSCRSGTSGDSAAWDEIGFLASELGCDRRAATRVWLEEAGLWEPRLEKQLKQSKSKSNPSEHTTSTSSDQTIDTSETDEASGSTEKSPLRAFYQALSLSDVDREELRTKRGLSDEVIDASGFGSNIQSNLGALTALCVEFAEWELVRCGLWVNTAKKYKPSAQFYGYGVVGKKKKLPLELLASGDYSEFGDDDFIWAWKESGVCNPILIPYFDLKGELIALRPHKGFPRNQPPRLYLAGGLQAVKQCTRAVVVEGEFKAAALQSVLGSTWAVASVPGITQVKNLDVWADIVAWLKLIGAKQVVVAFDNEEQGDPGLSSFRPLVQDRHESEVWARVCAIRLEREGYDARVARLPDEWRDDTGKADWDSALAGLLRAGKERTEIATLFERILLGAQTVPELMKSNCFEPESETSIRNRVAVRTYEPALPWGGEAEQRLAKHLRRLADRILPEWKARILALAEAYEKTKGWYYELKISEQRREKLFAELAVAENMEQIKFLKLALKGTPNLVAPFRLIPCYVLVKPDGSRDRLVKLRNIRGEYSGLVALDANAFTAPRDFRRWLTSQGNYNWQGGERQLQALQQDIDFYLAYREVIQLVCYGCERADDLWFLEDSAFASDGALVPPDHDGIFWYQAKGYTFLKNADGVPRGEEGQDFRIKSPPRMFPDSGLVFDPTGKLCLQKSVPDNPAAIQDLLGSFVIHLNESYGGYDGAMLIGATTAFFAGPDLFTEHNQFPGIWITGEKGGGKTFTARWLLALCGLARIDSGLSFKTSSAVGVQIAMGQYANIPIWGDEYKETELRDSNILGVIHGGFNRELPSKWSADGRTRSVRTSLIITGESTCSNAATMSRFISVIAAREKWSGTAEEQRIRLEWLQQHRHLFFTIGRHVLRNRARFVERLKAHLAAWEKSSELAQIEPRTRFTHGVSYASFMALNELIPVLEAKMLAKFNLWMVQRTREASEELAARVDVSQFFIDVLTAFQAGVFGKSPTDLQRYFKVCDNPKSTPPLSAQQFKDAGESPYCAWRSIQLAFLPGPVIDALRKHKHTQGQSLALDQSDLYTQLKFRQYFVKPSSHQGHQKKFGKGSRTNQYCWVVDLDKFPDLGLQLVSDDDWRSSLHLDGNPSQKMLSAQDWIDPRKGPLFAIVDALLDKDPE